MIPVVPRGESSMDVSFELTAGDLRSALERGVRLRDLEAQLLRRMKLPASDRTAAGPLFLLQQAAPAFAELVEQWMGGAWRPPGRKPPAKNPAVLAPVSPRGLDVPAYIKRLCGAGLPAVIAVDAAPAEVGAALHYACSIHYGLGGPVRIACLHDDHIVQEMEFCADDFLCELAIWCLQHKVPLIPLNVPQGLVSSEFQFLYNQMLAEAQHEFVRRARSLHDPAKLEQLAGALTQQVFGSGYNLMAEREDLITRACYIASRIFDLACHLRDQGSGKPPWLVFYNMQLSLDLPPLTPMFFTTPDSVAEMYEPLEPQQMVTYDLRGHAGAAEQGIECPGSAHSKKMRRAVEKLLKDKREEKLDHEQVAELSARVVHALRRHPLVERPPGVRGSLAMAEITQGLGIMHGAVTRAALAKAAFVAMPHRFRLVPGDDGSKERVLKSIVGRIMYDIPLYPRDEEHRLEKRRPMTPEELARALQGLTDAAFRQLGPEEPMPTADPEFAHEAMNHPLVQQALKDAMDKGLLQDSFSDYKDLVEELEDRGFLDLNDAACMTLSQQGRDALEDSLQASYNAGEMTAEELAAALKNSRGMPPPPDLGGEKMQLPAQAATELIAEMMDFQHQGRSESTSLEDLYVHYSIGENKGLEIAKEKVDYDRLKIMVHELEKSGVLKVTGEKKRFSLSHLSLEKLLKSLIQHQEGQVLEKRAFKKEHEIDKTDVRRYRRGDVFKNISMRHTLRRVLRKGKSFADINYTDLRAFERKPANQLDIAVCVDISASMKEGGKLRYAKMAVAELAKAAIDKGDRMGIIAFSNLGEVVVPLTATLQPLMEATMTLRSEQYTNIGNGLRVARRMLQKDCNSNAKFIVLITDGEPNAALSEDSRGNGYHARVAEFSRGTSMETKRAMGAQHALQEAAITRRKHIKVAVVFICPQDTADHESERVARAIARIGGGKFHKVRALERLPIEALATVV